MCRHLNAHWQCKNAAKLLEQTNKCYNSTQQLSECKHFTQWQYLVCAIFPGFPNSSRLFQPLHLFYFLFKFQLLTFCINIAADSTYLNFHTLQKLKLKCGYVQLRILWKRYLCKRDMWKKYFVKEGFEKETFVKETFSVQCTGLHYVFTNKHIIDWMALADCPAMSFLFVSSLSSTFGDQLSRLRTCKLT